MRRWLRILAIALGLAVVLLPAAGAVLFWQLAKQSVALAEDALRTPFPLDDCTALQRPATPNHWFAAGGECAANADAPAPEFAMPAEEQAALWRQWLGQQQDVEVAPPGSDPLAIRAVATTALFGFVDIVAIRALPLSENRSTLAIYSRSLVGESDLGANQERVEAWLEAFSKAAGS